MRRIVKWTGLSAGLLAVAVLLLVGGWMLTEGAIQATSDRTFCATCHSMRPFAEAYDRAVHGGQNPGGLAADCVDCHLPHDSPSQYLAAKVRTGIHDIWSELRSVFREPDWIAGLERRAEYVFDSGCLRCHVALQGAPGANPAATFGHQAYFQDGSELRCVTCHAHVGHQDLLELLSDGSR
jgi:cytochrome c-type protein NapC